VRDINNRRFSGQSELSVSSSLLHSSRV
jgi:hypothetical protein